MLWGGEGGIFGIAHYGISQVAASSARNIGVAVKARCR